MTNRDRSRTERRFITRTCEWSPSGADSPMWIGEFVSLKNPWRGSCSLGGRDAYCPESRSLTVLILLLTAALALPAQTGRITGTIIEARTGTPLPAVLVKVQSTGQQAFSDADGKFEIADVPVG